MKCSPAFEADDGSHSEMRLSVLLDGFVALSDADDCPIGGVQLDSRKLENGDVFIALPGDTVHGLDYISTAIEKRVAVVLVAAGDSNFTQNIRDALNAASIKAFAVDNLSTRTGEIASRFYARPSSALKVVGVTGTDGKTSVCQLLQQALNVNSRHCGVLGTLGWGFGDQMHHTGLTTPDAVVIQSALASMRDSGAKTVAMEVSSHALAQERVAGIVFDVAVFTNLGRDHLDYHGSMQSYSEAKQLLFSKPHLRAAVINADDEFGVLLIERLLDIDLFSYGANEHDGNHVRYFDVEHMTAGLSFKLQYQSETYPVKSGLLGSFNVQNIAATFAVLLALGISPSLASESLSNLKPVPGRMESTLLPNGAVAIVDYAHNPHALESVLKSIATHCSGKLLLVFGCGGDRDRGKRPLMAEVAQRYSDICVVTDDNPRSESGDAIVADINKGFTSLDKVLVERDRKTAIELAIAKAGKGDIVVVAGKGHEDYQLVGDKTLPFSDSAVVAACAGAPL